MPLKSTLGTAAPRNTRSRIMQSTSRTVGTNYDRARAAGPVARAAERPYVRKRPDTPPMTGLQESGTAVEQAQAIQEQAGIRPSAGDSGGGGGSADSGSGSGGGGQQTATSEEQKYQQDQAEYVQKLAAYNAQLAEAGPSTSLAAPTPPVKQEGIFTRFFNWLFGKKGQTPSVSGDPVVDAVAQLVQRARQGDQNAMGMIASVRQSAQKGNPRARRAFAALKAYIANHPVNGVTIGKDETPYGMKGGYYSDTGDSGHMIGPAFGAEERAACKARTSLANHALLTNDRISQYADAFGSEDEQKLFAHGLKKFRHDKKIKKHAKCLPGDKASALLMGCDIGHARNIQRVRLPQSMISDFSPIIGWELGE